MLALSLCAVLSISVGTDFTAIGDHVSDAGYVGALPVAEQQALSKYLRAHQGTARYEVAAQSATQIGGLIVKDGRPVVILTSYGARVFTGVDKLKHLIAAGEVRYAFLNSPCPHHLAAKNPACSAPAQWIRAHAHRRLAGRRAGTRQGALAPARAWRHERRAASRWPSSARSRATPGAWRWTRSSSARVATARCCA